MCRVVLVRLTPVVQVALSRQGQPSGGGDVSAYVGSLGGTHPGSFGRRSVVKVTPPAEGMFQLCGVVYADVGDI